MPEPDVGPEASHIQDSTIEHLNNAQKDNTNNFCKRLYRFIKYHFVPNPFEQYVYENEANDCSLVAKFQQTTTISLEGCRDISVDSVTLNTAHIPHPLTSYLKKHTEIDNTKVMSELEETPIIFFIHGLGGQISQFEPLMALFSQCAEVIGIDLPGFGGSKIEFSDSRKSITKISLEDKKKILESISKMSWNDFSTGNIVDILIAYIEQNVDSNKKLVIVGHSMGTHLAIKLTKKLQERKVEGLILLSPPALLDDVTNTKDSLQKPAQNPSTITMLKIFTYLPFIFNSFRIWDRIQGLDSKSVLRQLVPATNIYNKLRQFRWNLDIDSRIILRYVNGFHKASYSDLVTAISKFNNNRLNQRTYIKTLIVGGSNDTVTPVKAIHDIETFLNTQFNDKVSEAIEVSNVGHSILLIKPEFTSGSIINYIEHNYPERLHLSPAWVLRVKADISGDKWGLKNELKWLALQPISTNISRVHGNVIESAPLLGMKTLREGDLNHLPLILEHLFYDDNGNPLKRDREPKGQLIAVVDISHDIPPYSPQSFKYVRYYKCATVSKVVPDQGAIRRFVQLIDDIISSSEVPNPLIVVHCHYGFNRTGFLICCYLIERLGWSVQEAVDGYKKAKSPGIKHTHFIDALYVRYES